MSIYCFYFTYIHVYHVYHSFKAKLKSKYLYLHAIIIANKKNLIEVMIEVIVITSDSRSEGCVFESRRGQS